MKKLILFLFLSVGVLVVYSQDTDVATLRETAANFLKKGDYDNAILVLNKAIAQDPNDVALQKDLVFASYLKRDFAKSKEVGEALVKSPDADVQMFHMLGLTYKAIADYKEAEKLYKTGIKKFPAEGILYSEYGEMIKEKEPAKATELFLTGVEADPNHSTNYYELAKIFAQKGEVLWSLLYAETFLNLESFTPKSTEIKNLLLDGYKKFYLTLSPNANTDAKAGDFVKAVTSVLANQQSQVALGITPESLTSIRTRFVLDWFDKHAEKYPFRLFDHQRQLLQEGLFDAYNQWLFGPAANLASYQLWQKYHQEDYNAYLDFVRGRVYKVPEGQNYKGFN